MTRFRTLAALGSSFAAGPGITPVAEPNAMRSGRNYPHLLAEALGARLVDLTVSGATTATLLTEPQVAMSGVRFAPQLDGVPPDADLVTVTAGGNDLQYLGSMLYAAWRRHDPDNPMIAMLDAEFPDGLRAPGNDDVERATAGLASVVEAVRARAPRARVLLVDYLTIVGDGTRADGGPFDDDELAVFAATGRALEQAYEAAATRSGAELVRASALSRDHALGAAESWVFGFIPVLSRTGASFHPNELGMAAVAREIAAHLGA